MHFFTEPSKLINVQGVTEKYGPVSGFLDTKYRVTSKFDIGGGNSAKVYACQAAMMLVVPSTDSSKVNLILKPSNNLKINSTPVKYYIYRGVKKSGLISGSNILPQSPPPATSEFIDRFWEDFEDYKVQTAQPSLADPLPVKIGYDTVLAGGTLLQDIFNGEYPPLEPVFVKEGEELGEYLGGLGFEIILQNDLFLLDYDYAKKEEHIIEVTGAMSVLEEKFEREKILAYIDPSAFWGSHYSASIDVSEDSFDLKTTTATSGNDIYTNLLDNKYLTKNTVYIDIRSEYGYSYNYYENYGDVSDNLLKIKGEGAASFLTDLYYTHAWPLFFTQSPMMLIGSENVNKFKLKLRIDDNLDPLLYFQNEALFGANGGEEYFDEDKVLDGSNIDWSQELDFQFPNTEVLGSKINVSFYFKFYYFRKENNVSSPAKVFQSQSFKDNAFGPIELNDLVSTPSVFQKIENSRPALVNGMFGSDLFTYVGGSGAISDDDTVLFYIKKNIRIKPSASTISLDDHRNTKILDFEGFKGYVNIAHLKIIESGVSINVPQTTSLAKHPGIPFKHAEDFMVLGLSKTELQTLYDLPDFDSSHKRFIILEEVVGSPFVETYSFRNVEKYELKISGWSATGNHIISPPTGIFVYKLQGAFTGVCFGSKQFGINSVGGTSITYVRNYEEKMGNAGMEDLFINKNPSLKAEVDAFIADLDLIGDGDTSYNLIKDLIDLRGPTLFDLAVDGVKVEMLKALTDVPEPKPDDRPLYWARLKIGVAIKSHLHFKNVQNLQDQSSILEMPIRVLKNSPLDLLIWRFEEKTRNYTGVDFSGSTADFNLLVTGFDPFGLDDNKYQSNPSGPCALAMHGEELMAGSKSVFIQAMMVPVRWEDFDSSLLVDKGVGFGIVEKYIGPFVGRGLGKPDMIITISQSSRGAFHIDRFATINRGGSTDNVSFTRPGDAKTNKSYSVDFGRTRDKSDSFWNRYLAKRWYKTQLPKGMIKVFDPGDDVENQSDEWGHYVTYAQDYKSFISFNENSSKKIWSDTITPPSFVAVKNLKPEFPEKAMRITPLITPLSFSYMHDGPGGNYLSNEIFYRVSRLREKWETDNPSEDKYPTGHYHVSNIQARIVDYAKTYAIADGYVHYQNYQDLDQDYRYYDFTKQFNTTGYENLSGRSVFNETYRLVKTVIDSTLKGISTYDNEDDLL